MNQDHGKKLLEGVEQFNQWRKLNPNVRPDLSNAKLANAELSGVKLSHANLTGADLSGATLIEATLIGADLSRADLSESVLEHAELTNIIVSQNTKLPNRFDRSKSNL